jgi:hypothetical protein
MRTVESSKILATSADATPIGALAADPFSDEGVDDVGAGGDGSGDAGDGGPGVVVDEAARVWFERRGIVHLPSKR